jgi:selenide,water dikinase
LADVLKDLPQATHPNLLVGYNTADDAGVYRLSDELALVQTLDFFPPIVDDPYFFGAIAAGNALSDVYAMGGVPVTALNIVCFPQGTLEPGILTQILNGGQAKIEEAGAVVVGGHSINDRELKYGVSVTGLVHPDKVITNSGAKPGDLLFLTKRLGSGIISTAIKNDAATAEQIDAAINEMVMLNRIASELMVKHGATAATDITGFSLMGHAYELAAASNVSLEIDSGSLPLLSGALELASKKMLTGGSKSNREYLSEKVIIAESIDQPMNEIAFDPQTSGGLLISMPENRAATFASDLKKQGLYSQPIGRVVSKSEFSIYLK